MDREKAENWPAKQRILVDSGVRRIIALQQHPAVRSVTAVLGPQNGDFYNLLEEYEREMARHAKALADGGVAVIDPWPLLLATTREDGYHMETNELNTRMCVTFYKAMIGGNFACRQVWHHRAHFAANDRSVVFNRHFRLGMVEREFHLPPCTDMVVPEVGQEAPVQRCAEEEITFQIPIVQDDEARTAVPEDLVITVGDLDHAFLDREVGEKNVTEDHERDDIHVAHTIEAIANADAVAAPDEVEEVAAQMDHPRLTAAVDTDSEDEVINVFGPIEMPKFVSVLPPIIAARPRESAGSSTDIPKAKPRPEPARAAIEPKRPTLPPPTLSEARWIMGSDLPDLKQTIRRLDDDTRELISRRMTFVLRGWSNSKKDDPTAPKVYFREDDMSVEFDEFVEAMKKVYRAINVAKIAEVAKFGTKNRFETYGSPDESLGLRFHRIRAIQGHWRIVMSNDTDLRTTHLTAWVLDDQWNGKLSTRAFPGPYGYAHKDFGLVPKPGCHHPTYRQCFAGLLTHGFIPSDLNLDQSRGFVVPFPRLAARGQSKRPPRSSWTASKVAGSS